MRQRSIKIESTSDTSAYNIVIGSGLLAGAGRWARKCLGSNAERVTIVSNPTVFKLYGSAVQGSLVEAGFTVSSFLMKDGERHKSLKTTADLLSFLSNAGITRTDTAIALGGGVVGDLAGFAASVHLRGIAVLQIPTTLLAMVDSSVGGKTGVNSPAGKNVIGSFHPPAGVLIDVDVLLTLPAREMTAGFCEMIKQGAIGGRDLLMQTSELLSTPSDYSALPKTLADVIAAHVTFKAAIVAADPRELPGRRDAKSRKILNFGHTLAHALETATDYRYFKHGEAVGYGIMFAAELSKSLALCDGKVVKSLNDVVHSVGPLPPLANVDPDKVLAAFRSDKKNLAGSLQMVLLKGIGKPVILTENYIPRTAITSVLKRLFQEWA